MLHTRQLDGAGTDCSLETIQMEFFAHIELDEHQNGPIQRRRSRGLVFDGNSSHAWHFMSARNGPAVKRRAFLSHLFHSSRRRERRLTCRNAQLR